MEHSPRSDVTPSVTGVRPLPAPEPPAALTSEGLRKSLRGPLVYYLLAAFDVLIVSASLYLNQRIMDIYVRSVRSNQEWARRSASYSALGELAGQVNAPGNDAFSSRDVAAEAVRLQRARLAFQGRLRALRADMPPAKSSCWKAKRSQAFQLK